MNPMPLNPPEALEITNFLYDVDDLEFLTQDILTVRLKDDVFIDVGWYPEHDPTGDFWIRVFQFEWENQLLDKPIRTKDRREVLEWVEKIARTLSPGESRLNAIPCTTLSRNPVLSRVFSPSFSVEFCSA